jgi:beta-galactosidase
MFAERQGYHLPSPPSSKWGSCNPIEIGILASGVGFFTTSFKLSVSEGYDVPMSFVLNQTASEAISKNNGQNYMCQLFVNGYQFGKYGEGVSFISLV